MPAEHYRYYVKQDNGPLFGLVREVGLAQGYFCVTCGQACAMMGHKECVPNPELVKELIELNK